MKISRQKVWLINISVSAVAAFLLIYFSRDMIISLNNFLLSINRPLAATSFNIIDVLIIGLIPVWSYFQYSSKAIITVEDIVFANLITLFSIVVMCIITFILCAKFVPPIFPWMPGYFVYTPFTSFFWTMIFAAGVLIPLLIRKIIQWVKKRNDE
jgi:hypothetical protein